MEPDSRDRHVRPMLQWLERAAWDSPTGWVTPSQVAGTLQAHGKAVTEVTVLRILDRAADQGVALGNEGQYRTRPKLIRTEDLALGVVLVSQTARRLEADGGWVTAADIFDAGKVGRPLYELIALLNEAVGWGLESPWRARTPDLVSGRPVAASSPASSAVGGRPAVSEFRLASPGFGRRVGGEFSASDGHRGGRSHRRRDVGE